MDGYSFKELIIEGWNYFWFLVIAIMGGTANYINRLKQKNLPFSFVELMGEWFISGFAGIVTMNICLDWGVSIHFTAAATGIAGHMGGRGIFLLESYVASKFPGSKRN